MTVKAEHDGKVVIDGNGELSQYGASGVNMWNKEYIQVEGLRITTRVAHQAVAIKGSQYIKVKRMGRPRLLLR